MKIFLSVIILLLPISIHNLYNTYIKNEEETLYTKTIITTDCDNNIISKRKSPKKGNIYDLFSELTGIYPILLNENFTLEILEINMSEIRIKTDELVQSQNKKTGWKCVRL